MLVRAVRGGSQAKAAGPSKEKEKGRSEIGRSETGWA